MKISEVIAKLQEVQREHGDLDVLVYDLESSIHYPVNIEVRSTEILRHEQRYGYGMIIPGGEMFVEIEN